MIIADCGHETDHLDGIRIGDKWELYCKACAGVIRELRDCIPARPEQLAREGIPPTPEQLAEAHCEYAVKIFRMGYVPAMVHGIKHGREIERKIWEAK